MGHITKSLLMFAFHNITSQVETHSYLHIVDDPVDKQLRCSSHNQILLLAGYKVAVDRKLHCSGGVCLSVHSIHPGQVPSASDR